MNNKKQLIDVMNDIMRRAIRFDEMSKDTSKAGDKTEDGGVVIRTHTDEDKRVYAETAHELRRVAGELAGVL